MHLEYSVKFLGSIELLYFINQPFLPLPTPSLVSGISGMVVTTKNDNAMLHIILCP